jgi:hypothetical protein
MAAFRKTLSDELITFIQAQPIYFTASGTGSGRINLSPKGVDSFRVLDPQTVGYMDLTGSGNETSAHLLADGRLTIMFCSFGEKPLILRLYGRGRVIRPDAAEWAMYRDQFPALPGQRQIVLLDIESVQTSCGFGVPRMNLVAPRDTLTDWAKKQGPEGVAEYQRKKNVVSIDGLKTSVTLED